MFQTAGPEEQKAYDLKLSVWTLVESWKLSERSCACSMRCWATEPDSLVLDLGDAPTNVHCLFKNIDL